MENIKNLVEKLYEFRDFYFIHHETKEADKKYSLLKEELNKVLIEFEMAEPTLKDKEEYYMLKGKALNVLNYYDPQAEFLLTKAIKLNPEMSEAWASLGESYWKNGKLEEAKKCLESSLKYKKNKVCLRNLSMLLRSTSSDEDKKKQIENSVKMAKEALQLDLNDGSSWITYGNALLANFFVSEQDMTIMKQVLTSYNKASEDKVASTNFDLHFNKGCVFEFLEKYELSLKSYKQASLLDPSFEEASLKHSQLISFLHKINNLVIDKGKLKKKKLKNIISQINVSSCLGPNQSLISKEGYVIKNINQLNFGENIKSIVMVRLVGCVPSDNRAFLSFAAVDSNGQCVALSIFNCSSNVLLKVTDSLVIFEPTHHLIHFTYGDEQFDFCSIRINSPLQLIINAKRPKNLILNPNISSHIMCSE